MPHRLSMDRLRFGSFDMTSTWARFDATTGHVTLDLERGIE